MKRIAFLISIILLALTVVTAQPAYALKQEMYYALHNGTAVYAEKDFGSAILERLDKDTSIQVIDTQISDDIKWYKVISGSRYGYAAAYDLYQKTNTDNFVIRYAKITSDKSGADIYIYASPSLESEELVKLSDGKKVMLTGVLSGDFSEIEYEGIRGYVLSSAITRGLTYHQYLAFIVGAVCFAALVLVLALAYFNRNKKKS